SRGCPEWSVKGSVALPAYRATPADRGRLLEDGQRDSPRRPGRQPGRGRRTQRTEGDERGRARTRAGRDPLRPQVRGLEAGPRERLLTVLRGGPAHVAFHVGEAGTAAAALLIAARRAALQVAERDRAHLLELP